MKECLNDKFIKIANCNTSFAVRQIVETIPGDRLRDTILFLHGYILNLRTKHGWCPVEIALPDDRMVLVTTKTKKGCCSVNRAYYSDGFWHGSGSMSRVIAWMTLPEPYGVDADD